MDVAFYKKGSYIAMINHYLRNSDLTDNEDYTKNSPYEKYAVGDDINVDLKQKIRELINESEKTTGRSLKKDTTLLADWVIQVPHEIEKNPDLMNKFFKLATYFTKKEYGYTTVGFAHLNEYRVMRYKDNVGNLFTKKIATRPHIHIAFIPYGRYIDKRYNREKIGFNYGFRFNGSKALLSYQYKLENFLTEQFKKLGVPSLDFGKGNSIKDENGKKQNVKELKKQNNLKTFEKDEIIAQYEQIINTQKKLFMAKYKDNPQVRKDFNETFLESVKRVEEHSLRQRIFTRVKRFIENVLFKKHPTGGVPVK